jgi:GNAT superfamily N-acetyltransferase
MRSLFSSSLPPRCVLRRASAKDICLIFNLVLSEKLDPTQLDWQQFWVIEREGHFVACGQLRNFPGAQELGTLVVVPAWRGRGLGSFLVKYLIQEATQPLYLECVGERTGEARSFVLRSTGFGLLRMYPNSFGIVDRVKSRGFYRQPVLSLKFALCPSLFRTLFGILCGGFMLLRNPIGLSM